MEFTGQITFIGEKEEVGENKLQKQSINLEEVDKQHPNTLQVNFWGDKIMLLWSYKMGDVVKVSLNLKLTESKKDKGRFFNNINGWKIEKVEKKEDLPF